MAGQELDQTLHAARRSSSASRSGTQTWRSASVTAAVPGH